MIHFDPDDEIIEFWLGEDWRVYKDIEEDEELDRETKRDIATGFEKCSQEIKSKMAKVLLKEDTDGNAEEDTTQRLRAQLRREFRKADKKEKEKTEKVKMANAQATKRTGQKSKKRTAGGQKNALFAEGI